MITGIIRSQIITSVTMVMPGKYCRCRILAVRCLPGKWWQWHFHTSWDPCSQINVSGREYLRVCIPHHRIPITQMHGLGFKFFHLHQGPSIYCTLKKSYFLTPCPCCTAYIFRSLPLAHVQVSFSTSFTKFNTQTSAKSRLFTIGTKYLQAKIC